MKQNEIEAIISYWNQTEHPDLEERVCECGESHLNFPLAPSAKCPVCHRIESNHGA